MLGHLLVGTSLLLLNPLLVEASNTCQPSTWKQNGVFGRRAEPTPVPTTTDNGDDGDDPIPTLKPGDVNCRGWDDAPKEITYYTCQELAERHRITVDAFYILNPELKGDCKNVQPKHEYCVKGYLEPLRAYDGKCGPPNKNATCVGTDKQCCNASTWTCGDTEADCAPGTCFEGLCPGDGVWSTDGKCGRDHGFKQCAGKQGDCCSMQGKCGKGPDFCGEGKCQMGNCDIFKTSSAAPSATNQPRMAAMDMF